MLSALHIAIGIFDFFYTICYVFHMQTRTAFIILISFAAIAVFGFFGMYSMNDHKTCFAAVAMRTVGCLENISVFFHIDSFKHLVLAVVSQGVLIAAFAVFGIAVAVTLAKSQLNFLLPRIFNGSLEHFFVAIMPFLRLLSLQEHSPTIFSV